jgi:hypothetical protein
MSKNKALILVIVLLVATVWACECQASSMTCTVTGDITSVSYTGPGQIVSNPFEDWQGLYYWYNNGIVQGMAMYPSEEYPATTQQNTATHAGSPWLTLMEATSSILGDASVRMQTTLIGSGPSGSASNFGILSESATSVWTFGCYISYGATPPPADPETLTFVMDYTYSYAVDQSGGNPFTYVQWSSSAAIRNADYSYDETRQIMAFNSGPGDSGSGSFTFPDISLTNWNTYEIEGIYYKLGYIAIFLDTQQYGNTPINPVPIPGTVALFGSGLFGLLGFGYRKMKG